jgi:hypothetical protein
MGIGVVLLILFNFGISWLNAWSVGKIWTETKTVGGFAHFTTWCAAIMSASGFTWVYTIVLAMLAGNVPYKGHILLAPRYVNGAIELGYLVVILPILGAGLGITISSWKEFKRNRSFMNGGVAGYNTFAQIYNTVEAIRVVPRILEDLSGLFFGKSSDKDNNSVMLMIGLVVLAIVGGFLTTFSIIQHSAAAQRVKVKRELASI